MSPKRIWALLGVPVESRIVSADAAPAKPPTAAAKTTADAIRRIVFGFIKTPTNAIHVIADARVDEKIK